jgi:hypothetical protein
MPDSHRGGAARSSAGSAGLDGQELPRYSERLNVPVAWWLLAVPTVVTLGGYFFEVLNDPWPLVIMAGLGAICAVLLLLLGRPRIEVTGQVLRAGGKELRLPAVAQVIALDERQTAQLRGPRADPAAYLYSRPYLKQSVYLALADQRVPYWLIGTRHPAELAAAVEECLAGKEPVA